jgi:hypothetical protein
MRGIDPLHQHISGWNWVCLADLFDILTGLRPEGKAMTLPSISTPWDFFRRYGLLAGHNRVGRATVTWFGEDCYAFNAPPSDIPEHVSKARLHIPNNFADSVLDLAQLGIVWVRSRPRPIGVYTHDEHPVLVHDLYGVDMDEQDHLIASKGIHGPHWLADKIG